MVPLIQDIIKNEGISAFFKGVIPNLILVTNPIINFVVYENLKKYAIKHYYKKEKAITFLAIFFMSSIGKILATFATYPILTVRVRL
jgi:solute carrier family 25 (peroxisomal adenine nucleotide transporter), member 17